MYLKLDLYNKALDSYSEAYHIRQAILRQTLRNTVKLMSSIAHLHELKGDYELALKYLLLEKKSKMLSMGEEYPSLSNCLKNIS